MHLTILYIQFSLILSVIGLLAIVFSIVTEKLSNRISSLNLLKINYLYFAVSIVFILIIKFIPIVSFVAPSSQTYQEVQQANNFKNVSSILINNAKSISGKVINKNEKALSFFIIMMLFLLFARFVFVLFKTIKSAKNSYVYKQIGNVSIRISDTEKIPYVFSYLRHSCVVLPSIYLTNPESLRIAVAHELQHIRQHDTLLLYLFQFVNLLFFWNPIIRRWNKEISLYQEFSCDEFLIVHRKFHPKKYAESIVEATKNIQSSLLISFGTNGIGFVQSRHQLIRRLNKMRTISSKKVNKMFLFVFLSISLLLASTSAYAVSLLNSHKQLSFDDVLKLTKKDTFSKSFPMNVNAEVVEQLNNLIESGYAKKTMDNYLKHKKLLTSYISKYNHPTELLAIPFVESGFKVSEHSKNPGMWQFIPETAISFNLIVNDDLDERKSIERETDAAMRYLAALNYRFEDWQLSILSYNVGAQTVQNGINHTNSRNAWTIIKDGLGNNNDYLAKVMAAVIIMKNPDLIK